MMNATTTLPEGYRQILQVDLQKNKRIALLINAMALIIAFILVVPMLFVIPFSTLFDFSGGILPYLLRFGTLIVGLLLYMVLHELVHGITMKAFGTKRVRYGFTGIYAFAGSDDYYGKAAYLTIALAPVAVFGILFGVLCALVPTDWFWIVYLLQITNLSGAAGDLYVTLKFLRMPRDILIRDCGVGMTVYSKTNLEETK